MSSLEEKSPTNLMDHIMGDEEDINPLLLPKWHVNEDLLNTCESVNRGMSLQEELERRRKGIRFMKYMMRYLTFETIIQGNTLNQTKTPRVFPAAVHFYHRFYTIHPFQYFNEYVTAVACVFHAAKVEEHIMPISRILDLARVNAISLPWVKIPEDLSFDKKGWAALWKNEVSDTEFLLFTTLNPMKFLFSNAYGFILMFLRKWVVTAIKEEQAVKIRDKAFSIASDVYSCGSTLVVTEHPRNIACMCLSVVLKQLKITILNWAGKDQNPDQKHWYQVGDLSTTQESLKKTEVTFLAHLKQYNLVKTREEKSKSKEKKGVSPSSDYGSEGSVASNPMSPADSMCSDRDAVSNEATSPAASTASSTDHGVSICFKEEGRENLKRPVVVKRIDLAPPCQVSLSVKKERISVEPIQKKRRIDYSPIGF